MIIPHYQLISVGPATITGPELSEQQEGYLGTQSKNYRCKSNSIFGLGNGTNRIRRIRPMNLGPKPR